MRSQKPNACKSVDPQRADSANPSRCSWTTSGAAKVSSRSCCGGVDIDGDHDDRVNDKSNDGDDSDDDGAGKNHAHLGEGNDDETMLTMSVIVTIMR